MDMRIHSDSLLLVFSNVHVNHGNLDPNTRILHQILFGPGNPLLEDNATDLFDVLRLSFVEVALEDHFEQLLMGYFGH
jgi:hypothetical protein